MNEVKINDLGKDDIERLIKLLEKVLLVCPESDLQIITDELEEARSALKKFENIKTITPNEVKKGATVLFDDGRIGEVVDNRKGIRRMVKVPVIGQPGSHDIGDEYVYKWEEVMQGNVRYKVKLTEALQKQAEQIRMFMG